MATRIYKVKSQQREWLIRASTRNQAIAFAAGKEMEARVATQDDIVAALESGQRVERVKQEGDE
jgi:hypothetical protein